MNNVSKIRILHITKRYPPYIGGTEMLCHDTCSALKNDFEQLVFAFNSTKQTVEETYDGINVIRAGVTLTIKSQPISARYNKLLFETINDFKPDIIHFDYPNPFGAHCLLKAIKKSKWAGIFVLFWVMDVVKQKIIEKLFRKQTIKLIEMAKVIQILSPVYSKNTSYLPFYDKNYKVLAPRVGDSRLTITDEQIKKAELIKKENAGKTICFFFGRHVEYKGIKHIIEANNYLDRKRIQIFIGGHGPLTKQLMKMSKKFDNIVFLGVLSNDDVNAYLMACDIFLFPSITRNEAFGISLAEAMWFGKPGITFSIKGSGVNWVSLNGETGIEVENGNSRKYAESIMLLSTDKELYSRLSKNAYNRAHSLFSVEAFEKSALDTYHELVKDL